MKFKLIGLLSVIIIVVIVLLVQPKKIDPLDVCTKQALEEGINLLANNGGFIHEYEPTLKTTKREVAYFQYNLLHTAPSKEFMESELATYVQEKVNSCMQLSNETFWSDPVVDINKDSIQITHIFYIQQFDNEITFNYESPLGKAIQARDSIRNLEQGEPINFTDYNLDVFALDEYNYAFELVDGNDFRFAFAVKYPSVNESRINFTKPLEDKKIVAGLPLVFDIDCTSYCEFEDDTILFDINRYAGEVQYIPDALDKGIHNITITATNGVYVTEDSFTLEVI